MLLTARFLYTIHQAVGVVEASANESITRLAHAAASSGEDIIEAIGDATVTLTETVQDHLEEVSGRWAWCMHWIITAVCLGSVTLVFKLTQWFAYVVDLCKSRCRRRLSDEELFGTPVLTDGYDIVGEMIKTEITDEHLRVPVGLASSADRDRGVGVRSLKPIIHHCLPMRLEMGKVPSSAASDNDDATSCVSVLTDRSIVSGASTQATQLDNDIPMSLFPASGGEQLFCVAIPTLADYCANFAGVREICNQAGTIVGRPGTSTERCWGVNRNRGTALGRESLVYIDPRLIGYVFPKYSRSAQVGFDLREFARCTCPGWRNCRQRSQVCLHVGAVLLRHRKTFFTPRIDEADESVPEVVQPSSSSGDVVASSLEAPTAGPVGPASGADGIAAASPGKNVTFDPNSPERQSPPKAVTAVLFGDDGELKEEATSASSVRGNRSPTSRKVETLVPWDRKGTIFENYDESADEAVKLGNFGICRAVCSAAEAQKMACFLLGQATKDGPTQHVVVSAYTYDQPNVHEAICRAGRAGADVKVVLDRAYTASKMNALLCCQGLLEHGVKLYFTSGIPIQREYAAIGARVPNVVGIQHSKTVRVGPWYLTGSCNWSTSSRCNLEVDTLVELHCDRTARDKEKIIFANAVRQERVDIEYAISRVRQKDQEKIERTRSASAGRTTTEILRDAPLADARYDSRGGLTLDYRTPRSRSYGR